MKTVKDVNGKANYKVEANGEVAFFVRVDGAKKFFDKLASGDKKVYTVVKSVDPIEAWKTHYLWNDISEIINLL